MNISVLGGMLETGLWGPKSLNWALPEETSIHTAKMKAIKMAKDMPGMTTTRLPYVDYYLTIRKARNSEWQK